MKYAFRGSFLDFTEDPFFVPQQECVRYIKDGLLVVGNGKILDFGDYSKLQGKYQGIEDTRYTGKLITPGFIDTHVHYPQTKIIASYGEQLLTWLKQYVYPEEEKFKNKEYAREVASFFLEELLRNGTTTALVLATTHPDSVNVFFEEALMRNLRMIAGKMMMDRNAPEEVLETPGQSRKACEQLIEKWHGKGRLSYALTPRFAVSCTPEMLNVVGEIKKEYHDVYIHTHLAENKQEIKKVRELFPDCTDYLDVYERFSMVTDRSVFAHGIYLSDSQLERLSRAGATIASCPTSNLFLGSGLFKMSKTKSREFPVKVGIGTDVGAGTSFSMLKTLHEAYKVAALNEKKLSPFQAFYLATLGGARSLSLDDKIGNFDPGKEADFVVLDLAASPLMKFRNQDGVAESLPQLAEKLFAALVLGDDRAVCAAYIMGKELYKKLLT
ncbi:MAG: guanine deaminase [Candidatus Aminicenantes bacterium]|jgi:guanine deaminase